jgi:hypothetical protein
MVRAVLICSDDDCTAVFEAYGPIEEIETLACDCGCALAVLAWPELVSENGRVEQLDLSPIYSDR